MDGAISKKMFHQHYMFLILQTVIFESFQNETNSGQKVIDFVVFEII